MSYTSSYSSYSPSCPRCHMTAVEVLGASETVLCSACGWTTSRKEITQELNADKSFAFRLFLIGFATLAALVHIAMWGAHARAIIPLKAKHLMSIANVEDLRAIEKICVNQKRRNCLETVYSDIIAMDPKDVRSAAELGHIRFKRKNYTAAEAAYLAHFHRQGQDAKAASQLALMLDSQNKVKEAKHYYELALALEPERIQTDLIKNYVAMLTRVNRTKEALRVIETIRRRGPVLRYFMAQEFDQLKKRSI